ncbi:uncharacterized protein LOC130176621 [Seriola aureovittata]|nr:uncharacterized protein LOC130176621 [Seriola aureovittata]XP_056243781.1 uncharacterized protein LOC130176621 [Seriola aureovittata]
MERDIKDYVKCCRRCVLAKTPEPAARAPLESIHTSAPMELVCIDFWSAEDSKQRSVDVLVVTDHFTKLAHAFPCVNQTAKQVAKKLWDNVFCIYGFPERIHSDQGANFESKLISELLSLAGVAKSHTTAYHPMGNGQTERFNRTLGSMLRSLPLAAKQHWAQQIQTLTFAYNATVHETTGYAPFYLMFGRIPRLPVDMVFQQVLKDTNVVDYKTYAGKLMASLREAASIAQQHARKEQQHQADGYNKKVRGTCLNVGDRVLLANKAERGKRKLADKWEPTIYTVIDCNPQTHIYKIKDESGKTKVVHRNLILDVSFLPIPEQTGAEPSSATTDEISGSQTRLADALRGLSEETSEIRTNSWVSMSPDVDCESLGDGKETKEMDERSESSTLDTDQMSCAGSHDNSADGGSVERREEVLPPRDLPDVTVDGDQAPMQNSGLERHAVRTRTGRVVKAVNRLIENMAQKPLPRGIMRGFGRKSQSLLTLF